MLAALDEVVTRQFGLFTTSQALAAGYSRDEVRSRLRMHEWVRRRRGVYCTADASARAASGAVPAHLLDCAAVLLVLGRGVAVSHASAAAVHSLVLPAAWSSEVRLTDPENWRVGRGYRVSQAQLARAERVPWGPFDVTTVARTLVDCAREWDLIESVIAMDDAVHRRLVTPAALRATVLQERHWEGIAGAARAVGLVNGRAESPLESRGRVLMVTSGLPVPELQVDLWDGDGFIGRVDAWFEDAAVAVEFDGAVKYLDPRDGRTPGQVLWEEKRREDRIRATGVRPVRLTMTDVGVGWQASRRRLADLLASPYVGRRAFRAVPARARAN